MRHRVRNLFVISCILIITGSIGAGLHIYLFFGLFESAIAGGVIFCVLMVMHNNMMLQRHFTRVEQHLRETYRFEHGVGERVRKLETSNNERLMEKAGLGTGQRFDIEIPSEINEELAEGISGDISEPIAQIGKATGLLAELSNPGNNNNSSPAPANANISSAYQFGAEHENTQQHGSDNIITLKGRLKQFEQSTQNFNGRQGDKGAFKIKPSQLNQALNSGGAELFLQPILELPSRNIRFFEAFIRLRIGDDILSAKQFLPAAKDSGQIARIDLLSLELTLKVVRGLQRQNKRFPVFWNIAAQSLGNKVIFGEILDQLRANQPLNRQLICEISHCVFNKLNKVQSDNLARIRDLGFEMSLDNIDSLQCADSFFKDLIDEGMFSVLKIPSQELMRIGQGDISNFANYIVPFAMSHNITLVGSEVENDAQTVSLIDADVYLAQGNGLMPAKALKKELGGF